MTYSTIRINAQFNDAGIDDVSEFFSDEDDLDMDGNEKEKEEGEEDENNDDDDADDLN